MLKPDILEESENDVLYERFIEVEYILFQTTEGKLLLTDAET